MARKPAPPATPGIAMPALYANHTHVAWADGVIRLTMSESLGDQILPRAALLITASQARELQGLLQQALDALTPKPAEAVFSAS